jgi:flagellar biosynthesis/type III secretory pathway protein FliH
MNELRRVRIIRAPVLGAPAEDAPLLTPEARTRLARKELEAGERARETLARARAEAEALVAEARRAALDVATAARREAREEQETRLAAAFLALRRAEEAHADRDLDRAIALAVVMAERLIGSALDHDPSLVASLARQALAEARGARRTTIEASPGDVPALERCLSEGGFDGYAVEVRPSPSLDRGSLRLVTDLGAVSAELRPQLERLASALRDTVARS